MSKYFISILLMVSALLASAQNKNVSELIKTSDTIHKTPVKVYIGFDIGKFVMAQLKDASSVDFVIDINYQKYFLVFEMGVENRNIDNSFLNYQSKGKYFRLGIDYDLYDNWEGMDNHINLGIRYAYAGFENNLFGYTVNQPNHIWTPQYQTAGKTFDQLSANWVELVSRVEVETFKNVYLGYSISLKYLLNCTQPDNFDVGYIPGFYKKNTYSNLGFGMQYTISYKFDF